MKTSLCAALYQHKVNQFNNKKKKKLIDNHQYHNLSID
jgi:hypothetical protein